QRAMLEHRLASRTAAHEIVGSHAERGSQRHKRARTHVLAATGLDLRDRRPAHARADCELLAAPATPLSRAPKPVSDPDVDILGHSPPLVPGPRLETREHMLSL